MGSRALSARLLCLLPRALGDYVRLLRQIHGELSFWHQVTSDRAQDALAADDVPVGAVVLDETGTVIGTGHNTREADADPTGHAEVVALRAAAAARGEWRLTGCTLVVTLEPCTMCAGALVLARVDRLVFGASRLIRDAAVETGPCGSATRGTGGASGAGFFSGVSGNSRGSTPTSPLERSTKLAMEI